MLKSPDVIPAEPLPQRCALDETRGVLCYSIESLSDVEPDRRITLARLAMRYGDMLGFKMVGTPPDEDPAVNVTQEDIELLDERNLHPGLYVYSDDPRYNDQELLVKFSFMAGVEQARQEGLKLPFDLNRQPAVMFPPKEHAIANKNPHLLVRKIKVNTAAANDGSQNQPEVDRRKNSAAGQAMAKYVVKLNQLADGYRADKKLVTSLHKQTRGVLRSATEPRPHQNQFRAGNLDFARRRFDFMMHDTIRIVGLGNGWSDAQIHAARKADIAQRYRADTPREIDEAWRERLGVQGLFINARYFKVIQALKACEVYATMYRPFIREVIESERAQAA